MNANLSNNLWCEHQTAVLRTDSKAAHNSAQAQPEKGMRLCAERLR
jgi:hypothetical protein